MKFSFKLLAILMLFGVGIVGTPKALAFTPDERILTVVLVSEGAETEVSSTLTADHRIIGYDAIASTAGKIGLYDVSATSGTVNAASNFHEAQVVANTLEPVRFPFPRKLTTGLTARFSSTDGMVTVYYE